MKQLLFLLSISFLVISCENESTTNEDDNDPETPALILKEMLVVNETSGAQELSFFNTLGQPIKNDEYLNSTFITRDKIFYNSNNQRDSTRTLSGFEGESIKYNYENGLLTSILIDPISQAANIDFDISYDGNEMIVTSSIQRKYIFSDESHETLLTEEIFSDIENVDALPYVRYEHTYDSNSNLTQRTKLVLNDDTQTWEVIAITQYTYDDKKNPFKSLPGTNYLIMSNRLGHTPSIFTLNYQSTNNVLSRTEITEINPRQWIFEYEYNELGFPTNITESQYFDVTGDDVLDLTATLNKTLTYYDN